MSAHNIRQATIAVCLSVFGGAFLVIAGLWPEWTAAVTAVAVMGWACAIGAFLAVINIRDSDN